MAKVLLTDAYVTVSIDNIAGYVRYVRSREAYPSLDVVRDVHQRVGMVLSLLPRSALGLLIDMREAPSRNDDAFEVEIVRIIENMHSYFRVHAALVKSAVGKLQVQRIAKSAGRTDPSVFSTEPEALAYLAAKSKVGGPR